MSFKEILNKLNVKNKLKKERFKQLEEEKRFLEILENRSKSSNLRELEGYYNEEREKDIKEQLIKMRKNRQDDINFGHNPLDAENVIAKKGWEVMKENNIFKNNKNIFSNQEFIHKSNPNLLNNNPSLYGI